MPTWIATSKPLRWGRSGSAEVWQLDLQRRVLGGELPQQRGDVGAPEADRRLGDDRAAQRPGPLGDLLLQLPDLAQDRVHLVGQENG